MNVLLLILGFVLLIKCADIFVDGSVLISEYFRIPSFIIGITIVAMGTSAPEAAISITASIHSSDGIAVGNVIGSNIFNLLIVLGISALIRPLPVSTRILKVEYPLALLAAVMIPFLSNNLFSSDELILTRIDGILLLAVFIFFMAITVQSGLRNTPGCPTFPSRLPLAQLDHVYARGLHCARQFVPQHAHGHAGSHNWPSLSDHLPLVAEFVLP